MTPPDEFVAVVPVLTFLLSFFLPRCCCKRMVVNKGKSPLLFFFFLGLYYACMHVTVLLGHKFRSVCGDSLRRLWIITLRKQLAKVLNWKISKQPCGLSNQMKEYLRVKIPCLLGEGVQKLAKLSALSCTHAGSNATVNPM